MKKLFVGMAIVFMACRSSPPANLSEITTYSEVIDVPNVSMSDLYVRANLWFVDAFRSAKSVIEYSDKESGIIKGKYSFLTSTGKWWIISVITVEVRDGRYKITCSDPTQQSAEDARVVRQTQNVGFINNTLRPRWVELIASSKETIQRDSSAW
jgi:hypothetical protein